MLDLLIIHPNSSRTYQALASSESAIEPPTWSLMIAGAVRKNGFSVEILDCDAERLDSVLAFERVKYSNPKLICFVVYGQNPNSGTVNMAGATELAAYIKENSDYKIAFIGTHTSALPHSVIQFSYVDFVFINEGVRSLIHLLNTDLQTDLHKIGGFGYKTNGGFNITNGVGSLIPQNNLDEELGDYAWDLLPYKNKPLDIYKCHNFHNYYLDDRQPFAALYTSLGCHFKCSYCVINAVNRVKEDAHSHAGHSNQMRCWSTATIIKHIETLVGFGVKHLRLSDELFFFNKHHFEPLLKEIIKRGLNKELNMWAYCRVDTCQKKYLDLFKEAGINLLGLGIESFDRNVRREVTKGNFENVDISDIMGEIHSADIRVGCNVIFGLPDDTVETMQKTLDFSIELNPDTWNAYPCMALPGSPLYMEALLNNEELPEKFEEFGFLSYECKPLRNKNLTAGEILKFRDDAFHTFYEGERFQTMIGRKFGQRAVENVKNLCKIRLKRKILGD